MDWSELNEAIQETREIINMADNRVSDMIHIVTGRLQSSDPGLWNYSENLCKLKRELKQFNMVTKTWKD